MQNNLLPMITVPLDGAHLVVVRGLIHQEVPECANEESSMSVAAKAVRLTDLLNHNVKT